MRRENMRVLVLIYFPDFIFDFFFYVYFSSFQFIQVRSFHIAQFKCFRFL